MAFNARAGHSALPVLGGPQHLYESSVGETAAREGPPRIQGLGKIEFFISTSKRIIAVKVVVKPQVCTFCIFLAHFRSS